MSESKFNRIEFVVTYACTGRCRHCSQGEHDDKKVIDTDAAIESVYRITDKYNITSLMTFGGEALIYPDAVCRIHTAAKKIGIEKRQLITNGFFSRDEGYIRETVCRLHDSGINDLLLSVDVFHQETIPLEYVKLFAGQCLKNNIPTRLNPAWLGCRDADNPYNIRSREIVSEFTDMGIPEGSGNVIFPKGNAIKNFPEYFDGTQVDPYEDNTSLCFDPNSDFEGVLSQL